MTNSAEKFEEGRKGARNSTKRLSVTKVGGLVMALIVLQVISSAFNLLNLSPFLTVAIWGALIIGVTALSVLLQSLGLARR